MNTWQKTLLHRRSALFLDFDGTLADIAPRPEAVHVEPSVLISLQRLHTRLDGAVAIITGRTFEEVQRFLHPLRLAGAYEHGAIRKASTGESTQATIPLLDKVRAASEALLTQHPQLIVEQKHSSVAVHYRGAPALHGEVAKRLGEVADQDPELQMLRGKMVIEIKSARVGKGHAIAAFMQEEPFQGRTPVFVGDDVTDESGFETVQALGGAGIKIGEGTTAARHRMPSPSALRQWLQSAADQLEATP